MSSKLEMLEGQVNNAKENYLMKLKQDILDLLPAMGYQKQDFAALFEIHPTTLSKFFNKPGKTLSRQRLMAMESWVDKAKVTVVQMDARRKEELKVRGS